MVVLVSSDIIHLIGGSVNKVTSASSHDNQLQFSAQGHPYP